MKRTLFLASLALTSSCTFNERPQKETDPVTLYRNSPYSSLLRVHWATFDAVDGLAFNRGNCEMAARILNANLAAIDVAEEAAHDPALGFWCEDGPFEQAGRAPESFKAEFPSSSTSTMRFSE